MINNRYTEMAISGVPIITYDYETVDWYGAEHYLNFIRSAIELKDCVADIINRPDEYRYKSDELQKFMIQKDKEFFEKLNKLIKE